MRYIVFFVILALIFCFQSDIIDEYGLAADNFAVIVAAVILCFYNNINGPLFKQNSSTFKA